MPPFHFFFYLMALVAIGFGIGIRDACAGAIGWLAGRGRVARRRALMWTALATSFVTLLWVGGDYQQYRQRLDFTVLRREAIEMNGRYPVDVLDWIRLHTFPDDVFLCMDDASLYLVTPAGRKVVATNRYFSNPYVDWRSRDADRRRMFDQLASGDMDGFSRLAAKYRVRFVVVSQDRSDGWLRAAGLRPGDLPAITLAELSSRAEFDVEFRSDRFAIARLRSPAGWPVASDARR